VAMLVVERASAEVVEDQEVGFGHRGHEFVVTAIASGEG